MTAVLAERRFEALLVEVDDRRAAITRDLEAKWPSWRQEVEDAVQESFAALPRHRDAVERFSERQGRRPTVDDLEAKWRAGAAAKMLDARRRRQGRASGGPREFVSIDVLGDAVADAQRNAPDTSEDLLRQQFKELLMTLRDPEDRRYARIRLLEMTRAGDDGEEAVLTMAEARKELGWTQRQWNTRGAKVRAQIAAAAKRIHHREWCEEHFRAIGPWISAELDPHMHQRVSLHLEGCERCSTTALRMQSELREAARHVFDPTPAITLAGGLGLLGWVKAKIGLGAGAAVAGGSTAATGVGGSAIGGAAIGGTLITKACVGVAAIGCVAAVGGTLAENASETPRPKPADQTARAAQAARPAAINSSGRLGALPTQTTRSASTTTSPPMSGQPKRGAKAARQRGTRRERARARRATVRAAKALSPIGFSSVASTRSSPAAVRANDALGVQPAVSPAKSASAPTSSRWRDTSSLPAPRTAAGTAAAAKAFGP